MAHRTVSGLTIFPVKSCGGIELKNAFLDVRGFRFDRRWMIADQAGRFLTQREHPRLSLIGVKQEAGTFTLSAPGIPPLNIPLSVNDKPLIQVVIWNDTVEAMTAEPDAAEWISSYLGIPCRFIYMPDTSYRPVNPRYAFKREQVNFADAFPVLLISEASLADLNSRLDTPLPMNRFRPNIVVAGCSPYEEDTWKRIQIGSTTFLVAKPCDRCAITTVDQSTGIKGKEPLRTLAQYRNRDGQVLFGQNLIHERNGEIRVGEEVTILEFQPHEIPGVR